MKKQPNVARSTFAAKAYYIFMFLLPLVFYPGITDGLLLPRQLFLSAFSLFVGVYSIRVILYRDALNSIEATHLSMTIFLTTGILISVFNASVMSESLYVLSKWGIFIAFSVITVSLLINGLITVRQLITSGVIFSGVALGTALIEIVGRIAAGSELLINVQLIAGGFANKNLLSSILFLSLPFLMTGFQGQNRHKIITGIAVVSLIAVLMILRTRIVLIAATVFFSMIIFLYIRDRSKRIARLFVFAMASLLTLALMIFINAGSLNLSVSAKKYFERLINSDTLSERILFWQNSLKMFLEYPFGVGFGNWQIYFPKYGLAKFDSFPIENGLHTLQRPHNDFIWILCETGIIGLLAYSSIFVLAIYKSYKLAQSATNNYEKWLFRYLMAGILGFMMISFFDFPAERIEHIVLLMIMISIVIYKDCIRNPGQFVIKVKTNSVLLFSIVAALFSVAVAYVRFASETCVYKLYAAKSAGNSEEIISHAEQAQNLFYTIDSRTIPVEWYKGVAKFSMQDYAQSEPCFESAYRLTPYNIHVLNNLASCYEMNGKRAKAAEFYRKALYISPRFEEARLNLAAVYFNDKEYARAFDAIDSVSVKSKDPKYKMFLGHILKKKAALILRDEAPENLKNAEDYLELYYESKRNNITFERQIIRQLNQ